MNNKFRQWFIPCSVSYIGTWIENMASGWLIFEITHSAAWLSIITVCTWLPVLLFSKQAGVIVDRCNRYKTLYFTHGAQCFIAVLIFIILCFTCYY